MKQKLQNLIIAILLFSLFNVSCSNPASNNPNKIETIKEANIDYKSKNIDNLQVSYKGEVNATAKYKAYADKAELEKYHLIALLYKAVSFSENIHANNHKAVLTELGNAVPSIKPEYKVNSTKENLGNDVNRQHKVD